MRVPVLVVVLLSLSALACDERRLSGGGTTPPTAVRRDASASGDAGDFDAGFDDAGRPIDAGPRPIDPPFDGGTGPVVSNANTFCRERVRLECEANQRCCNEAARRYPSEAACVDARFDPDCLTGVAFDDGRARFDSARAASILAELRALTGACRRGDGSRYEIPVVGTVRAGGDCSVSGSDNSPRYACEPGTYCSGEVTGTCAPTARVGESCLERRCDERTTCSFRTNTCVGPVPLGSTCGEGGGICAEGYCVGGTCQREAASEDYCTGE